MIDILFWCCVLGFSPIVLAIGSSIVARLVGSSLGSAGRPQAPARSGRLGPHFDLNWSEPLRRPQHGR